MPLSTGPPILCDLGAARVGAQKHRGDIMPGLYRAPETWDFLEDGHVFFASKNRMLDDEQHLAEMVSLLAPPPPEFLKRSEKCRQYWDSEGIALISMFPPDSKKTVSKLERLYPDSGAIFRNPGAVPRWGGSGSLLTVLAQDVMLDTRGERLAAEELALDEFLMQPLVAAALSETSTQPI
ncbi:uncharacterized protein L3040_004982 [Drepanopeziza brunnea f. sp. 'multigermtubi']|uniref:uncharacterized protein n=1 Tax=Drepanopeziza brunnea f. sp. 'multigermtubi' TaxID=698441 RepID=UPI00238B6061|nr:hypothetical protein L3040_004982 [Drepanopeziza brunnea f. sp. 'multigermtubi']